jgi:hypothetical protein
MRLLMVRMTQSRSVTYAKRLFFIAGGKAVVVRSAYSDEAHMYTFELHY